MAAEQRRINFEVSAALYDAIMAEQALCRCDLNAFLHLAIAKEIHYRRLLRRAAAAPAQLDIEQQTTSDR